MTLQVVRAVDNLERYNITRSNVNIYHNVVIGNRIQSLHPTQHLPSFNSSTINAQQEWAQFLLDPVTWLIDQHPFLAVVLGDHLTAKPMFLRLESLDLLPLVRVVTIKEAADVAHVMEQEHNVPFDLSDQITPLWRLVVAPIENDPSSFYLLYTFHHVIGDGRSAMALTTQLIEQLNQQALKKNSLSVSQSTSTKTATMRIPVTSTKPAPASIESRVNCYPSLRTLVLEATKAILLPGFMKKALETKYWAGEIDSSLDVPNETELAFWQLTKEETEMVVQAARKRATTVQSILYAASIFATKSVFMSSGHEINSNNNGTTSTDDEAIVFATPVSLRGLIPNRIASEDQGNYTSEILHDNICVQDQSSFWEMTHAYRQQVVRATTTARGLQELLEHFGMLGLLSKKDGAWETFMASKVHKDQHGRKATVKLSNLGRGWTGTGAGLERVEFLVQDAVFSQSSGVTASALTMNVATANGVMTATTAWQKAAFRGRKRGEMFMSEFKRILFAAIEDSREEYLFRDV
ncbi:alcohol acetyltransferase-domain-containing protein [Dissophora ornata]|nr:alcohol acetyltransferase-domain-containing protein [Dissophora ornata]